MEKLEITKDNALKAYSDGSDSDRELLDRLFPGKLKKLSIIDRISAETPVQDACKILGLDFDCIHDDCEDKYEEAEKDIKVVAEALREGKDPKDCFYYPYFYRSGGGVSFGDYDADGGYSVVGARLRVDTPEKARHLGKVLEPQYKTYLTGQ